MIGRGSFPLIALLLVATAAIGQTNDPCDLVNGTSVVGNQVTLLEDLDCTAVAYPSWMIVLVNGGQLDLNGFTLKANHAVRCDDESTPCTVMSSAPGGTLRGPLPNPPIDPQYDDGIVGDAGVRVIGVTITGFAGNGIVAASYRRQKVTLERATVTANGGTGVWAANAQLFDSVVSDNGFGGVTTASLVRDSEIMGNVVFGMGAWRKLKMERSTVSDNGGDGIGLIRAHWEPGGPRAVLIESTITGNGDNGIRATDRPDGRVSLISTTIGGNGGSGIANVQLVKARDSTLVGNGASGIELSSMANCRALLTATTVGGNGIFGVTLGPPAQPCADGHFRASASTLTANGTDGDCDVTEACGDVASSSLPSLDASSACDRSYVLGSGLPGSNWSVCALD